MIEEIILILVEEPEQPIAEEEDEQMQYWELSQQIEQLIEVTNMELEKEL